MSKICYVDKQFAQRSLEMIDHSILSPSGRVSKRAREAAQERARREFFGDGLAFPTQEQPPEAERLLLRAAELRVLADGGMKPRAYRRKAKELEALAAEMLVNVVPAEVGNRE